MALDVGELTGRTCKHRGDEDRMERGGGIIKAVEKECSRIGWNRIQ